MRALLDDPGYTYTVRWAPTAPHDPVGGGKLWQARSKFLGPYRTLCARLPVALRGHALVWANLLERASMSYIAEIQGAELLVEDLGALIALAHDTAIGTATHRPPTTNALKNSDSEWSAAISWAAEVCTHQSLRTRLADYVPELHALDDQSGKAPVVRELEKVRAFQALATCCWPVQVTLRGRALTKLHDELVRPLSPPFIPLAEFLPSRGFHESEGAISGLVERWRAEVWHGQVFRFGEIRGMMRDARERVRQSHQ